MSKLKIAELFYSIQGEGRYMGGPSVFLRTFGCNFKCAGFGMPQGKPSQEVEAIAARIAEFKDYTELPLVSTGCDSYASWDPRFKSLSPLLSVDETVKQMLDVVPNNNWQQTNGNNVHLVITGGEPLLGWQRAYKELLEHPRMADLKNITFETNGTQELHKDFQQYLHTWAHHHDKDYWREITFSVSAKLSASGEKWEDAICPEIVASYEEIYYLFISIFFNRNSL